jgi:hypothetical protein
LLVSALFPLAVLYALRLPRERWHAAAPLALVFGAIWLTNAPAALMTSYALALLLIVAAWAERSPALLLPGGVALGVGLMLAAVYIVPAAAEQSWVRIHEALSAGLTPDENFLFARTPDRLHDAFNAMVSTMAVVEIAALALAVLVVWRARTPASSALRERFGKAWWPLAALGAGAALMMVRITAPLWHVLPKLRFIQLPWRWLVVLGVCMAVFATASLLAKPRYRIAAWVLTLALLVFAANTFVDHCWWDPGGADTLRSDALANGYDGSDEYAPLATDHYDLVKEIPPASFVGADGALSDAHARVPQWEPEQRRLEVESPAPGRVMLRLVSYPAWEVKVNGQRIETSAGEGTGEIIFPVAAGKSVIEVRFVRTSDRTLGGAVSAVGCVLLLGLWMVGPRRRANLPPASAIY